ncbi:hypothetical protein BT63DRAFT_17592 [Microthyrium microscopicum]|uniref:Uncharacterized protein n=1 Tax=Microthyrium microscopicum TaxID=703497 RepID=A0A6A6UUR1_9PEZI|nr:hypothetical protein BT63DRAFT_17592 [Microthyrium microscopicum]
MAILQLHSLVWARQPQQWTRVTLHWKRNVDNWLRHTIKDNTDSSCSDQTCAETTSIQVLNGCQSNYTISIPGSSNTQGIQRFGLVVLIDCSSASSTLGIFTGYLSRETNVTSKLINSTSIICSPTYQVGKAAITLNSAGSLTAYTPSTSTSALTGLNSGAFLKGVYNSALLGNFPSPAQLSTTSSTSSQLSWPKSLGSFTAAGLAPFLVLAGYSSPTANFETVGDLQSASVKAHNMLAAHVAAKYLQVASTKATTGTVTQFSARVIADQVAVRIIDVVVLLLILIVAVIAFERPTKVTSRDTSTIGGLATVLAQSPETVSIFRGTVNLSQKQLRNRIGSRNFTCGVQESSPPAYTIRSTASDQEASITGSFEPATFGAPKVWWDPLKDWYRIAVIIVGFLFIMALEFMSQSSRKHGGFGQLGTSGGVPAIAICFPAFFLTILGGIFGLIDHYTRILQPYRQLKTNPSTAPQSIFVNYLSRPALVAIWDAIMRKHIAVILTACVSIIAPFLVIVVGSLFVNQPMQASSSVTGIKLQTIFDASKIPSFNQSAIPIISNLPNNRSTSPAWTYDTYAIDQIALPSGFAPSADGTSSSTGPFSTMNIVVPALQAHLNCTPASSSDVLITVTPPNFGTTGVQRIISVPVPTGCGTPCSNETFSSTCDGKTRWEGASTTQMFTDFASLAAVGGLTFANVADMGTNSTSCPRFNLLWGKNSADGTLLEDFTVYNCYPYTNSLSVNATIQVPGYTVTSASPSSNSNTSVFTDSPKAIINPNTMFPKYSSSSIAPWFGAIIDSGDIASSDLTTTTSSQKIISAMDAMYGRVTAQNFNLNRRSTASSNEAQLNGTISSAYGMRLTQDTTITRVLEVMIAIMIILTGASFAFMDGRKLVPNNPCSIAGMASLIADSELVKSELVPPGSEWLSDRELRRQGVFEGYMFSMGMWGHAVEKSESVFGINIGQAEKVD